MFTVIGIMFAGIGAGYLLRRVGWLQKVGTSITYTIYLLLFLLGLSVGANREIVDNLATWADRHFCFAVAGTTGSVLAAWAVGSGFSRRKTQMRGSLIVVGFCARLPAGGGWRTAGSMDKRAMRACMSCIC